MEIEIKKANNYRNGFAAQYRNPRTNEKQFVWYFIISKTASIVVHLPGVVSFPSDFLDQNGKRKTLLFEIELIWISLVCDALHSLWLCWFKAYDKEKTHDQFCILDVSIQTIQIFALIRNEFIKSKCCSRDSPTQCYQRTW